MRFVRTVGMVAALILTVAGCSDEAGGNGGVEPTVDLPTATGEPTADVAGGESTAPPADAPKVANPVQNLNKFMTAPCSMITESQAGKLDYPQATPEKDEGNGPGCEWAHKSGDDFQITLLKDQPNGIAGIYQINKEDPYAYFEPVDVAGFPGVFHSYDDGRSDGACGLAVGVTDTQIINLVTLHGAGGPGQSDPCGLLKRGAEAAVTTMSKS